MRNGFRTPTRASSPRQLPTDHDHAVATREYQSDQSSRMLLGCLRPCCPKQVLKAHQRERVPAPPPVDVLVDARTVLAAKGSLRRAKNGRALDCSAPFRPDRIRDGRLRREHFTGCCTRTKTPAPCGSRLDSKKSVRLSQGLTGSLHIRTSGVRRLVSGAAPTAGCWWPWVRGSWKMEPCRRWCGRHN